jgi:hypothetical protein
MLTFWLLSFAAVNPCVDDYYLGFDGLTLQTAIPVRGGQKLIDFSIIFIGYSQSAHIVSTTQVGTVDL